MKSFSPSKDLIESLIRTEFKQDVNIIMIFKEMLKANNVFVLKWSVNLDLRKKLKWSNITFVLARLFVSEDFVMSFAAYWTFGGSKVVNS